MWIDTHCHLTSNKFKVDLREVLNRAFSEGVEKMIVPATNVKDAQRVIELCENNHRLKAVIGVYPGEVKDKDGLEKELKKIRQLIKLNPKVVVGIGEIGLDDYWLKRQPELEREMFKEQMELGVELGLPVEIHQRNTEKEMWQIMRALTELPQGQFHCWSGSDKFLEYVLERGFYIGFDGNISYKANQKLREQIKLVPDDKIVLETDAPYLPPTGHRGERNEPANMLITARVMAQAKNITMLELSKLTTANAKKLYSL